MDALPVLELPAVAESALELPAVPPHPIRLRAQLFDKAAAHPAPARTPPKGNKPAATHTHPSSMLAIALVACARQQRRSTHT